jgi:hypothetical protein
MVNANGDYVCKHCYATVESCVLCGEAAWPPPIYRDAAGEPVCADCQDVENGGDELV